MEESLRATKNLFRVLISICTIYLMLHFYPSEILQVQSAINELSLFKFYDEAIIDSSSINILLRSIELKEREKGTENVYSKEISTLLNRGLYTPNIGLGIAKEMVEKGKRFHSKVFFQKKNIYDTSKSLSQILNENIPKLDSLEYTSQSDINSAFKDFEKRIKQKKILSLDSISISLKKSYIKTPMKANIIVFELYSENNIFLDSLEINISTINRPLPVNINNLVKDGYRKLEFDFGNNYIFGMYLRDAIVLDGKTPKEIMNDLIEKKTDIENNSPKIFDYTIKESLLKIFGIPSIIIVLLQLFSHLTHIETIIDRGCKIFQEFPFLIFFEDELSKKMTWFLIVFYPTAISVLIACRYYEVIDRYITSQINFTLTFFVLLFSALVNKKINSIRSKWLGIEEQIDEKFLAT